MKFDPNKTYKVTKVEGVNYSLIIKQKISALRILVSSKLVPNVSCEALDDFKALFMITLNCVEEWDYKLICNSLDLSYSESKSKILKDISIKWFKASVNFPYRRYIVGLEKICAHSDFEIEEDEYRIIEGAAFRFHALYVCTLLEDSHPERSPAEMEFKAKLQRGRIKSHLHPINEFSVGIMKLHERMGPV